MGHNWKVGKGEQLLLCAIRCSDLIHIPKNYINIMKISPKVIELGVYKNVWRKIKGGKGGN